MQRYFSHICDGTDVQADWRSSFTYGRVPNAIDISLGSLTCPSYIDTGPLFLYGYSEKSPHLVAFYDTLGIRSIISNLDMSFFTWIFGSALNNNTSSLVLLDHCYELGLLVLHSDLKKKSFGEGAPHWPIIAPPWIHSEADLVVKP